MIPMGLFGKLFDKKVCDICGGEIGLLGNKKLEDGNCCKECVKKLSPWFSDRRHSTVESIKEQIDYREANKAAVAAFHTTRTLGRYTKVLLDEDQQKFMVTSAKNISEENPDVLDYAQVTGCDLDVDESRTEQMREVKQQDGTTKRVSYPIPRYTYSYNFRMTIHVNHPYFDEMRFNLNNMNIKIEHEGRYPIGDPAAVSVDYRECERMGQEIKRVLTQAQSRVRRETAAAAKPKAAVTCPWCGATTTPDASGCCEYCGGSVNG